MGRGDGPRRRRRPVRLRLDRDSTTQAIALLRQWLLNRKLLTHSVDEALWRNTDGFSARFYPGAAVGAIPRPVTRARSPKAGLPPEVRQLHHLLSTEAAPLTAIGQNLRRNAAPTGPLWTALGLLGFLVFGLAIPRGIDVVPAPRDLALFIAGVAIAGIGFFRPPFAVVATVAAFIFSGLVRRVLPTADPTADLTAIVPFIIALPLAARGFRVHKPLQVSLLLGWFTIVATASLGSSLVSAAGWLNIVIPLAAAFGVRQIDGGPATLIRALVWCATAAAVYGMIQYVVAIPWDIRWLRDSRLVSAGVFGNANFRPFATYASPVTAATISATVMLVLLYGLGPERLARPLKALAFSSCTALVLLTGVRVVWVAFVGTLIVGTLLSSRLRWRTLILPVVAVAAFLLVAPQADIVLKRAGTFLELDADRSLADRRGLLSQTDDLASLFGRGLGEFSAASRVEGDRSIDIGFLVVLAETGVVGLGLLVWVLGTAARRSTSEDRPFLVLLVVSNLGGLSLTNIPGLVMWCLCGLTRPVVGDGPQEPVGDAPVAGIGTR